MHLCPHTKLSVTRQTSDLHTWSLPRELAAAAIPRLRSRHRPHLLGDRAHRTCADVPRRAPPDRRQALRQSRLVLHAPRDPLGRAPVGQIPVTAHQSSFAIANNPGRSLLASSMLVFEPITTTRPRRAISAATSAKARTSATVVESTSSRTRLRTA